MALHGGGDFIAWEILTSRTPLVWFLQAALRVASSSPSESLEGFAPPPASGKLSL